MLRTRLNRCTGFCRPLSGGCEFFTSFDGFSLVVPVDDAGVVSEVRVAYLQPRKGDVVVDAGAHYGFYSLLASRLVGGRGLVLAFEPASDNYRGLIKNLKLNHAGNIAPLKMALGSRDGEGELYHSTHSGARALTPFPPPYRNLHSERVRVAKLDTVLPALGISRVDLIKLDVEGFELEVLKGAVATLAKHKPSLTIAAYHALWEKAAVKRWLMENAPFYRLTETKHYVHATCEGGV